MTKRQQNVAILALLILIVILLVNIPKVREMHERRVIHYMDTTGRHAVYTDEWEQVLDSLTERADALAAQIEQLQREKGVAP